MNEISQRNSESLFKFYFQSSVRFSEENDYKFAENANNCYSCGLSVLQ